VDLIFSSPEPKALQTAKPAARRWDIPLKIVNCLHELHRPQASLIPDYEDIIGRVFADPEASIAGLEPASRAAERVTGCLHRLASTHPDRNLAVVSHGLVLTLFLAQLKNRWPTVTEWRAVPFGGIAVVNTDPWHLIEGWLSIPEAP
jgi:broad specificity phosphatase PhoE